MLLPRFAALALGASLANGYIDTSPFFMFSTSELLTSSPQIVLAAPLTKSITSQLSTCPSDTYVIVTQPGVHAEDYADGFFAPHLRKKVQGGDGRIRSSVSVTDVLGDVDTGVLVREVERECGAALLRVDASTGSFAVADDPKPRVIHLDFPALPMGDERSSKLQENDAFLASLLDLLPTSKYTVIYTTSPLPSSSFPITPSSSSAAAEPATYEMDTSFSSQQTHMELKRDTLAHAQNGTGGSDAGNVTLVDGPLFERYAFLSPGIFMGLLIFIPLFLILYVGVSGVGSLQVSYAAFDREMGPAAHKKQQ